MPRRRGARRDKSKGETPLARLRLDSGATQEEIARAIGVPAVSYGRLERGERNDEPPLRELVNTGIVLTGDPAALLHEYLHWHQLDARAEEPPAPDSIAPGVPPAPVPVDEQSPIEKLTAGERELLRSIADALAKAPEGTREFSVEPDPPDRVELVVRALDSRGRRRVVARVGTGRKHFDGLVRAGLLGPATVALTPAGALYVEQRLRKS